MITPRTNQPSLVELWEEDIKALFFSPNSCPETFDGLCVPKIDTLADIEKVHDVLEDVEQIQKGDTKHYKIIP